MKRMTCYITLAILALLVSSCTTVRPWERVYLNDPQMQLHHATGKNFSNYVHSIREGSVPAGSTKSSGGCGCN
jgi:hypothetical protein